MLGAVAELLEDFDTDQALEVLLAREALGTTGIGEAIAIPHGKLEKLEDIILVFARSLDGVEYEALDKVPCSLFFLVLAPEKIVGQHLRILAQISRLLKDQVFRNNLLSATDQDEIWSLLQKS